MTTVVRFREPLRNVTMNGEAERLIKTLFESPARAAALSNHAWTPPIDIWETEGELVYAFDLPGVPEETIAVDLDDSTLTVIGSRQRTEIEDRRFFRYERPFGEFTRRSLCLKVAATASPAPTTPTACSKSTSRSSNSPSPADSRS